MTSSSVQDVLEQMLTAKEGDAPVKPDVATFIVGGRTFQILEQTVRSRGGTLLCDLLDDPERKNKCTPIYVEGDSDRFRYILDWYRYGTICVPFTVSLEEITRECAFFGLPDDIQIKCEPMGDWLKGVCDTRGIILNECLKESLRASAVAAANSLFHDLVSDNQLLLNGESQSTWRPLQSSDWKKCLVMHALFPAENWNGNDAHSIHKHAYSIFQDTLERLAEKHGFSITITEGSSNSKSKVVKLTARHSQRKRKAPEDGY